MTIGTRIFTLLYGQLVGMDEFGNRYYQHKSSPKKGMRRKRWVIYNGCAEASKIPAQWHGWMHYTSDTVPVGTSRRYSWQKEHLPNLTGTAGAYMPPGHILRGGRHAPATADYEAWKP